MAILKSVRTERNAVELTVQLDSGETVSVQVKERLGYAEGFILVGAGDSSQAIVTIGLDSGRLVPGFARHDDDGMLIPE